MPRFHSEEAKQEWLKKCAATRAATRAEKRGERPVKVNSSAVINGSALSAAIEEIESKIAALTKCKMALLDAQALV